MPVVTIVIKALSALSDGKKVIAGTCFPNIKEIGSSFACFYAFAENAFHFLIVVFVFHLRNDLIVKIFNCRKYSIVLNLPKF